MTGVTGVALEPADCVTVAGALQNASQLFSAAGVPSPVADAELLLGHLMGLNRGQVTAAALTGRALSAAEQREFCALVARRAAREPLQHITGTAGFYGLELSVGPGVFVPRPETECLVAWTLEQLEAAAPAAASELRIVDLCTGSGAIAAALACQLRAAGRQARVWAVEREQSAHAWAAKNLQRLAPEVQLLRADVAQLADAAAAHKSHPLAGLKGSCHAIVSNPPYVPALAVPSDPEVAHADPPAALYSGEDGLDLIREALIPFAAYLAAPGALVVIEHTEEQGVAVCQLLTVAGFCTAQTHPDLTGRPRFSSAYFGLSEAE